MRKYNFPQPIYESRQLGNIVIAGIRLAREGNESPGRASAERRLRGDAFPVIFHARVFFRARAQAAAPDETRRRDENYPPRAGIRQAKLEPKAAREIVDANWN